MRNFLRDIKISTKISLLTGLTVLLMTAVMGLGLRYINTIGNEVTAIAKENIPLASPPIKKAIISGIPWRVYFNKARDVIWI